MTYLIQKPVTKCCPFVCNSKMVLDRIKFYSIFEQGYIAQKDVSHFTETLMVFS